MGCNCGKKAQTTTQWMFTLNGQTSTYDTYVAGRAAQIRAGNQGELKEVAR